jgi:indolepyruvate ferredoxin oxidoreductase beta subunit
MKSYNVYMAGVGGQGIGLLSEVLLRAADHAGYAVKAVDTHGLAQRGGIVVSQLRLGSRVHSPLISNHCADLCIALERHEALRALNTALKEGGDLIYYDTVWQPLSVRLGTVEETTHAAIAEQCGHRSVSLYRVVQPDLQDTRMQNIVVLAHIDRHHLIDDIATEHYRLAMDDLMSGAMLEANLALFDSVRQP